MRIGFGYDAHPLVDGRKLILGGVAIPFEKGLMGHSDADVVCHAIADALLGAAGLGDLGIYFPDDQPRFKGISSLELLAEVAAILKKNGYRILNVDTTLVAQEPRIASFILQMRKLMARSLGIPKDRVSVKATTTEGLGFAGSQEGMEAYAVALVDEES